MGFGPLASVGPVSLGPGVAEKSSLEIPRVVVCVDPLQSLLQRKLILHLLADQAQVRSSTPLAISMHCMRVLWQLSDMYMQPQDERVKTFSRCQAPGSWVAIGQK